METPHNHTAAMRDAQDKLSELRAKLRLAKDPIVRTNLRLAIESSLLLLDGLALLRDMTAAPKAADLHS